MPIPDHVIVRGEKIPLARFDLVIVDVSKGMERIAAEIAYAGTLWAEAEMEAAEAEAGYRQWRATYAKELIGETEKMAEWKVSAEIESTAEFAACKDAIAATTRNALVLRNHFEALKAKANALQSRGAMLRAEMESHGMHTPASTRTPTKPSEPRTDIRGMATGGKGKTPEEKVAAAKRLAEAQDRKEAAAKAAAEKDPFDGDDLPM